MLFRSQAYEAAEQLGAQLQAAGVRVLLDDRPGVSPGVKFNDSELIGVPTIVVVGRRWADGFIEVKDRRTGERVDVAVDQAENCFPMIPSGGAHNEMLLGPADKRDKPTSQEGMVLV